MLLELLQKSWDVQLPIIHYRKGWTRLKNVDMHGKGDVELIHDWRSKKMSLEDLMLKVEQNNWPAIDLSQVLHVVVFRLPVL